MNIRWVKSYNETTSSSHCGIYVVTKHSPTGYVPIIMGPMGRIECTESQNEKEAMDRAESILSLITA